jgi:hypothetical protein
MLQCQASAMCGVWSCCDELGPSYQPEIPTQTNPTISSAWPQRLDCHHLKGNCRSSESSIHPIQGPIHVTMCSNMPVPLECTKLVSKSGHISHSHIPRAAAALKDLALPHQGKLQSPVVQERGSPKSDIFWKKKIHSRMQNITIHKHPIQKKV